MRLLAFILVLLLLSGCGRMSQVEPGRAAVREEGRIARVYPSGEAAREERHGRWRGLREDGSRAWELHYTRGNPSGPYREWDEAGSLRATWSYDWDGNFQGWARWYDDFGQEIYKMKFEEEGPRPDFDPIGNASGLRSWAEALENTEQAGDGDAP